MITRFGSFRKSVLSLVLIGIFVLILLQNVSAHAPLSGEQNNESLDTALVVSDPLKSWVIYKELHQAGEANYYELELEKNARLTMNLLIPISEKGKFLPGVVIMGPGVTDQGSVPDYIETPNGSHLMVINGEMPEKAYYEPFTPASSYMLLKTAINVTEQGTYYIAVFDNTSGGKYSLAIGYKEEFTVSEWLLIPINLISIHLWEGQNVVMLFAPLILTIGIGIFLIRWKKKNIFHTVPSWIGLLAGLLFIGSGFMTLTQMFYALSIAPDISALVTLIFAFIPLILGIVMVRILLRNPDKLTKRNRIVVGICSVLGLFFWAGLLVGPIVGIIAACLPSWAIQKKK